MSSSHEQDNESARRREIILRLADRLEAGVAGKLDLVSLFRMLEIDEPVAWFAEHGDPIADMEAAAHLMKEVLSEDEARDILAKSLINGAEFASPGAFLSHSLRLIIARSDH